MEAYSQRFWERFFSFFVSLYLVFLGVYFCQFDWLVIDMSHKKDICLFYAPLIFLFLSFFSRAFGRVRSKEAIVSSADGIVTVSTKAIREFVEALVLSYDLVQAVYLHVGLQRSKVIVKVSLDIYYTDRTADMVKIIHAHLKKSLLSLLGYRVKIEVDLNVRSLSSAYVQSQSTDTSKKIDHNPLYAVSSQIRGISDS